jgi:hypothetical protein
MESEGRLSPHREAKHGASQHSSTCDYTDMRHNFLVPEVGLEPTRRVDPRGILSPVRLPIPPLRHQSGN